MLRFEGPSIFGILPELARLRIEVFRAYPYLYDGDAGYEEAYLERYARVAGALVVAVRAAGRIVGATTGLPLAAADAAFREPFAEVDEWFYLGESLLEPEYRGRGLGHRFFDERERHARALGFSRTTFCAVERAEDHPGRPPGYRPLDAFWRARGYRACPQRVAHLSWRQIDAGGEVDNRLVFWCREEIEGCG